MYLYGESEPRNAVLLGVSECDDLAVLDIRGSGFPYLLWQDTPLAPPKSCMPPATRAASTQKPGGAYKIPDRSGDSDWASVDQVVRHTAELAIGEL